MWKGFLNQIDMISNPNSIICYYELVHFTQFSESLLFVK